MSGWDAWIGREERRHDRVDPATADRWLATLDRTPPADGTMPQGLHWCLCLPDAPTASLGEDGQPRRDDDPPGLLPPVPLPRRMWAASTITFVRPLRAGQSISRIAAITEKHGASGRLVFVDVTHETSADDGICIRETPSIVYREAASPGPAPATLLLDLARRHWGITG